MFRIGHIGDLNEGMCLTAIAVAEMALVEAGADIAFGSGVAAAQAWYSQSRTTDGVLNLAAE